MSEKETIKLFNGITGIDDDLIEEAQTSKLYKKKQTPIWRKWGAVAASFCLVAVGAAALFYLTDQSDSKSHTVQQWSDSFQAEDYFKYSSTDANGMQQSSSLADSEIPYAESRFFSDKREQFETAKMIPMMESHPLFHCVANYNSDGSIFDVEISWHRRGEKTDYSDLKIVAGLQKVELIEDCIFVELDEQGNLVEPTITVTNRDGIQIVAEGKADQQKIITFQNDSGWYQITGSWSDDYASVALLLDWIWEHPIDFTQFSIDAGDNYTYATMTEYPDAFADYLPDFEAFGFYESETSITLKNGVPVNFEGHYVAHAEKELVAADNYYDVPGYTKMHWCFVTEPDTYDLQRCIGELKEITEQMVLDALEKESSVAFTWGNHVVIVYPDSPYEAWELIASLQ